jgi:hypothetical protein
MWFYSFWFLSLWKSVKKHNLNPEITKVPNKDTPQLEDQSSASESGSIEDNSVSNHEHDARMIRLTKFMATRSSPNDKNPFEIFLSYMGKQQLLEGIIHDKSVSQEEIIDRINQLIQLMNTKSKLNEKSPIEILMLYVEKPHSEKQSFEKFLHEVFPHSSREVN